MSYEVGELTRGSIQGFPPRVVNTLLDSGCTDAERLLDHRGVEELRALQKVEERKTTGCLEAVLHLPVLRQVREALPQSLKDSVKVAVKHVLVPELAEP